MTKEELLEQRDKLITALEHVEGALLGAVKDISIGDDNLNIEECVRVYLMLRDARERGKERFERQDKALRSYQETIEDALGVHMQKTTVGGLNTKYGTVFTSPQSTARVADRDAFLSYLRDTNNWQLASVGANKATVADHMAEHEGELPPGVDWSSRVKVQIRRK